MVGISGAKGVWLRGACGQTNFLGPGMTANLSSSLPPCGPAAAVGQGTSVGAGCGRGPSARERAAGGPEAEQRLLAPHGRPPAGGSHATSMGPEQRLFVNCFPA